MKYKEMHGSDGSYFLGVEERMHLGGGTGLNHRTFPMSHHSDLHNSISL